MVQWLCDQEKDNRIPHLGLVHQRMRPAAWTIASVKAKEDRNA